MQREFNVLAMIKGEERYVYVHDDESREMLLKHFQQQAASSELSFTWFDAAILSEKAWQQAKSSENHL